MLKNKLTLMMVLAASMALSGCWESDKVNLSEAGTYKGAVDPMLAKAAARQAPLKKRFRMVQVDR